jgi:Domain of unknown function (DUF4153)
MSEATARPQTSIVLPALQEVWPDPGRSAEPAMLVAAAGVGLLAATLLPGHLPGLGALVVVLALTGVAWRAGLGSEQHGDRFRPAAVALCLALGSVLVLRDAGWVVSLCLLAAFGLGVVALCGPRTVPGLLGCSLVVPLAAVRGLPWLNRGVTSLGVARPRALWRVARTVLVTLVLAVVFGWLFAGADAVFATWTDRLLPEPKLDLAGWRVFAFVVFASLTLAVGYVAVVPPGADRLARAAGPPVRSFEWAVPVLAVDALFVVFLAAQLSSLFGGDTYVQATTGLTYAEYVHQGFAQLVVVTLLTLLVVATAARRAPKRARSERLLLRALLGVLCLLTFVVVASALHRLYVYDQAYGFTALRLLVAAFEIWLALLVALLVVAGVTLHGRWLPRAALAGGAAVLLVLAALNPDAYVAQHNVDRFERTGRLDWRYLRSLSADAVPALDRLPEPYRSCTLTDVAPVPDGDLFAWNLSRERAAEILRTRPVDVATRCGALPSG